MNSFHIPLLLAIASLPLASLHSSTLTWDASGTSPSAPTGGAGTWNTTGTNWSNGTSDTAWNNSAVNSAYFLGNLTAYAAITLAEPISVDAITFGAGGSNGYTIIGSGSNSLTVSSGVITVNRSSTIQASITGSNGLIKTGSSAVTLTLGSVNTYTGATLVQNGNLRLDTPGALPTGTTVVMGKAETSNNTTIDLRTSQTISGLATAGTGTALITNNRSSAGTATLTINPDSGSTAADSTFSGSIQDGSSGGLIALTKAGSHALTLTGTSTYTGATTVSGGTLVIGVSGAGSLASSVTVKNGATLSGSGSTSGNVTIETGGNLAPGNSAGQFTIGGALSLAADAVYQFELNGATRAADKVAANGISINAAADFSFTLLGGVSGLSIGNQFVILDNTGSGSISGTFSNLAAGSSFNAGNGLLFSVSSDGLGGYGNDLVLTITAVPESSTAVSLALGLSALWLVVRRRRNS
ncbi:MAG: autotransporter-associated beta strand repeat-containing protein [Verrucomicrobia bacterium]|nr:autotransporter-associated beta strand repeat-containing protein [Verrucomicrobiota bacterium]